MNDFKRALKRGIKILLAYRSKELLLFHHNDSDGIASGAVLLESFRRSGYRVCRFCLEKPYPGLLAKIFGAHSGKIIIFADFAGGISPLIASLNRGKNLVIILDHHNAAPSPHESVINLSPGLYGAKGGRDISASVVCYWFVRELDRKNRDLAHIAAFGGIADFYYLDGDVYSFNRICVEEAAGKGLMRRENINGA
ncbi:MAG: hypothetical protein LBJ31_07415 [Treponema sp.]|nr:hypothetical protein [Treponema sp.]